MEESGHYYSVYYISLAVGFLNRIARQHAFFAQMPDEVSMLDAADLEFSYLGYCRVGPVANSMDDHPEAGLRRLEMEQDCLRVNDWRIRVEHALHALTGRDAATEQAITRQLLLTTRDSDFLRLGFLLHRFGDTYAHAQLDQPDKLYFADPDFPLTSRAGHGHLRHKHEPDEPWGRNRRTLMRQYLTDLYGIFDTLAQRASPLTLRPMARTNKVSLAQVIDDFTMAERAVDAMTRRRQEDCANIARSTHLVCVDEDAGAQRVYIAALRRQIQERTGGTPFGIYEPENQGTLTWAEFREQYRYLYPILNQYNEQSLRSAVRQINIDTNTTPSPAF